MATIKSMRREAEREALSELRTSMIGVVGDLRVAVLERDGAVESANQARARAALILSDAHEAATAIETAADADLAAADHAYAGAWAAARASGWSPSQLRTMGYSRPTVRLTSPRRSSRETRDVLAPSMRNPAIATPDSVGPAGGASSTSRTYIDDVSSDTDEPSPHDDGDPR